MKLSPQLASILFQIPIQSIKGDYVDLTKGQLQLMENAIATISLIKLIEQARNRLQERQQTPLARLDQLKSLNTSTAKLYNWNIIIESLGLLNVQHNISGEVKQHILLGDLPVIEKTIQSIYQEYIVLNAQRPGSSQKRSSSSDFRRQESLRKVKSNQKETQENSDQPKRNRISSTYVGPLPVVSNESFNLNHSLTFQPTAPPSKPKQQVDLANVTKDPSQAHSALEFFISTLSKNLQINSKQAATLFADNNKYLAHVLAKGVQGVYEPIQNYLIEITSLSGVLLKMLDEKSLMFSLQVYIILYQSTIKCLKAGLVSKSPEALVKIYEDISEIKSQSLAEECYKWLVEFGGLSMIVLGIRRHPQLNSLFANCLVTYSKMHFLEFFSFVIRNQIQIEGERIQFIESIIGPLTEKRQVHDELLSLGIINNWYEYCLKSTIQNNDHKICAASKIFFSINFKNYYRPFGNDNDERATKIINFYKVLVNSKIISMILFTLNIMFQLLQTFTQIKHRAAPVIYKNLTVIFIDNYNNQDIKVFCLLNFQNTFQICPSIPISIVVEPLVKHLQTQLSVCQTLMSFFRAISSYKNLSVRSMIQILDSLAKVSIYDIAYYGITTELMFKLIARGFFIEEASPSILEFTIKYTKVVLSIYVKSVKQKKEQGASPIKTQQTASQVLEAQKRAQIVQFLKQLVGFENEEFNATLQVLVVQSEQQCRDVTRVPNKGMIAILQLFGKPEEIITQVKLELGNQAKLKANDTSKVDDSMDSSSVIGSQLIGSIGKKADKSKLSKEEQYHLASLRKPKNADPKVVAELEDVKMIYQNKVQQQAERLEISQFLVAKQKQNLRRQLEKRSIEQGIATYNQHDLETNLVFQDGSKQKELKNEKKSGVQFMNIVDLQDEEDCDRILVEVTLSQANKVLKWVFSKYAGKGPSITTPLSFDEVKQKNNLISIADLRKFLQDFELDTRISKEELQQLSRDVHIKLLHQRTELKTFEFQGFQVLFVQLAINLAQRAPFYAKHNAPFQAIQLILRYMRDIQASKKQNTALFDDPDSQYFSQSDVIQEFNKRLLGDPEYQLPEGFKKVPQPDLKFKYDISPHLNIKSSHIVAYEMVDHILSKIGTHLIEPLSVKYNFWKAQPNTFGYINKQNRESGRLSINEDKVKIQRGSSVIRAKRRVIEIEPKRELSLAIRLELSNFSLRDRATAEQVANLIDDIIYAVENKKTTIDRDAIIQNKAVEQRKSDEAMKKKQQEYREQRRKDRYVHVQKKLKQMQDNHEKVTINLKDQRNKEQATADKSKTIKQENRKEYLDGLKKKIHDNQLTQKDERVRAEEDKQSKIKELETKKKEFLKFNKDKIMQFVLSFNFIYTKKVELDNEKKQNQQDNMEKQKSEVEKKKRIQKLREQYKQMDVLRIFKEKETNQKITDMFHSQSYQDYMKAHQVQFQGLFDFLIKETFLPIGQQVSQTTITLKTYTWFCDRFKLTPEIFILSDVITVFRALTRDKQIVDRIPIGMSYDEFLQALHRLSIKGKQKFNLIAEQLKKVGTLQTNDLQQKQGNNIIKDEDQIESDTKVQQVTQQQSTKDREQPLYIQPSLTVKKVVIDDQEKVNGQEPQNSEKSPQVVNKKESTEVIDNETSLSPDKNNKSKPVQSKKDAIKSDRKLSPKSNIKQQGNSSRTQNTNDINKKNQQDQQLVLIDDYGNVDDANLDTLNALLVYLNISEDRNKQEQRFRQTLEEGKVPTKQRKQGKFNQLKIIIKDLEKVLLTPKRIQ